MSTPPPSRTAEQFVVRLPVGMRDQIASAAEENGRSMNAEIVHRLQLTFSAQNAIDIEVDKLEEVVIKVRSHVQTALNTLDRLNNRVDVTRRAAQRNRPLSGDEKDASGRPGTPKPDVIVGGMPGEVRLDNVPARDEASAASDSRDFNSPSA